MTTFFRRMAVVFLFISLLTLCCSCQTTPSSEVPTTDTPTTGVLVPNAASDFDYDTFEKDGERVIRLIRYKGERTDVVIPDTIDGLPVRILKGVTAQNENGHPRVVQGVFEDTSIESVYIPSSVSSLGRDSFAHCTKLEQVEFAKGCGITSLNTSTFESCTALTRIDLSPLTKLKGTYYYSFRDCTSLKEIIFPEGMTTIDEGSFLNCSALQSLYLPDSLEEIVKNAFEGCIGIESISVGKNLRLYEPAISNVIFNSPALKNIIFRDGVESLDGYAMFSITSPVSVEVPASVNVVSGNTFFNYNTMTITFAGDCPKMESEKWLGDVIVRYNPDKMGWSNCDWSAKKGTLTLEPIK
ncbi:MAG: leucine-rich repeat domain-containing protein [Clostridia bacterium]|nr:leucine-rich repeat domain-containing protein [Clostridia bacterium]